MTAVSTTGFSPGAIDYAEESGIELRSVQEISEDVIRDWFKVTVVHAAINQGELKGALVFVEPETGEDLLERIREFLKSVDANKKILKHSGTGEELSMMDAWRGFMNQNPQIFYDLVPNEEMKPIKVMVNYTNPNSRYILPFEDKEFHIKQILFQGNLSIKILNLPIGQVTEYGSLAESKPIAQSVHFEFHHRDQSLDLSIHRVTNDSGTYIFASSAPIERADDDSDLN